MTTRRSKSTAARKKAARRKKPKAAAPSKLVRRDTSETPSETGGPPGATLRSQAQLEIRLGRGARPLTATEQAARLASARMERRIGRLLSRRVKLKFR